MQKHLKIFLVVSSIIILTIILRFAYWSKDQAMTVVQNQVPLLSQSIQRQSDLTTNRKTYRSEGYRFTIQYPPEFHTAVENNIEIHWSGIGDNNFPWVLSIVIKNNPEMEERGDFPYTLYGWGLTNGYTYFLTKDPMTTAGEVFVGWITSDHITLKISTSDLPFDLFRCIVLGIEL